MKPAEEVVVEVDAMKYEHMTKIEFVRFIQRDALESAAADCREVSDACDFTNDKRGEFAADQCETKILTRIALIPKKDGGTIKQGGEEMSEPLTSYFTSEYALTQTEVSPRSKTSNVYRIYKADEVDSHVSALEAEVERLTKENREYEMMAGKAGWCWDRYEVALMEHQSIVWDLCKTVEAIEGKHFSSIGPKDFDNIRTRATELRERTLAAESERDALKEAIGRVKQNFDLFVVALQRGVAPDELINLIQIMNTLSPSPESQKGEPKPSPSAPKCVWTDLCKKPGDRGFGSESMTFQYKSFCGSGGSVEFHRHLPVDESCPSCGKPIEIREA